MWHSSTSWSPNWSQGPFAPSHVCGVLGPSLPHNEHSTTAGSCTSPIQAGKMCRAVQDSHVFFPCTLSKPLGTDVQSLHYSRAPGLLGTDWSERPKPCPTSLPALAVKAPSPQSSLFLRARLLCSRAGDVLHSAPTSGRAAPHRSSGMCGPQALPARISAQPLPWNKKVQMSP